VSGLGRAATGYEYAPVFSIRLVGPEEMGFGSPPLIVPGFAVGVQVVDRRRVGMAFVKVGYLRGD
jgi:hypothetical protein